MMKKINLITSKKMKKNKKQVNQSINWSIDQWVSLTLERIETWGRANLIIVEVISKTAEIKVVGIL